MDYTFQQIHAALQAAATRRKGNAHPAGISAAQFHNLRAAPHLSALLHEIRAEARASHDTPIPALPFSSLHLFNTAGTRIEYEQPYFARRTRLAALALAALIDAGDVHLAALQDTLWAICDEYSWCLPAHFGDGATPAGHGRQSPVYVVDLFAAETGFALSEIISLLADRLHPWIVERVHAEIERRVFHPMFSDPAPFAWETRLNNWAAVCGGSVGMTVLIAERDPERQAGMTYRCLSALDSFLEGFGADGGCAEGISYWQYGFGYFVYFSEMLFEYTQGEIDLLAAERGTPHPAHSHVDDARPSTVERGTPGPAHSRVDDARPSTDGRETPRPAHSRVDDVKPSTGEKIRRIAAFPAQVSLDRDHFVNFSDGALHAVLHPGLLCRLAARVQAPLPFLSGMVPFQRNSSWPYVTRDLLWTDPALFDRPVSGGGCYYPDMGWVIDRADIAGVPVAFAAKGGHNGESHNHNDLGHFILYAGGESLLADLGAGVYTREYFRSQRHEFIHTRSLGHSVPLINGQEQAAGAEHAAVVPRYEPTPDGLLLDLDLTRAYAVASLRQYTRAFRWSRAAASDVAELVVTDTFAFDAVPSTLEEIFISLLQPELTCGLVRWAGARAALNLPYDPARFSATSEAIPSQTHEHAPIMVHRLRLHVIVPQADETLRFMFALTVH